MKRLIIAMMVLSLIGSVAVGESPCKSTSNVQPEAKMQASERVEAVATQETAGTRQVQKNGTVREVKGQGNGQQGQAEGESDGGEDTEPVWVQADRGQNTDTTESGQIQQVQAEERVEKGPAVQERAGNITELRRMFQKQRMEMEARNLSVAYKKQNAVRLATHALVSVENFTTGIGRNVSVIAREFNNSVGVTLMAEERIQKRSGLTRFFFGGDYRAAEELEQEVNQNQERIMEFKRLMGEYGYSEEVKEMMQEQVQVMELEQLRLMELAQNERKDRGFLGWLWK